jgi:hypothetical protein
MMVVMRKDLVRMAKKQDLTCKQHAWKQWMCQNGNWLDVSLQHTITTIKGGSKITTTTQFWGVPISSLRNHLYKVTLNICKGKSSVLDKSERSDDYRYIQKLQQMGHHITLTQLWLKVTKVTLERATPFKNGILGVQKGYASTTLLSFMKTCSRPMACTIMIFLWLRTMTSLVHKQVIMVIPLCLPRLHQKQ